MKSVALTPFRLIPFITATFPDVSVPVEHDSEFNRKQIESSNSLYAFFDEKSKDPVASIGTKVEYANNKDKIEGRIFVNPDSTYRVMTESEVEDIISKSKLPTWTEYVDMMKFDVDPKKPDAIEDLKDHKTMLAIKQSPLEKTGKVIKVGEKEYTSCISFEHVLETNLHLCKNSENGSGRCGFSETDWKDCPISK